MDMFSITVKLVSQSTDPFNSKWSFSVTKMTQTSTLLLVLVIRVTNAMTSYSVLKTVILLVIVTLMFVTLLLVDV